MSSRTVVLDANALVPIRLASTLLWLAEAGLFQPLWSNRILDEVERNLPKLGVAPKQAARRVGSMREAFGAEVLHPDDFLLHMLELSPAAVIGALRAGVEDLRRPTETITDWLTGLVATVPMFATRASASIGE